MAGWFKKSMLALSLGATAVVATAPAEARGWRGGGYNYHHHRGNSGAVVGAGILGLAVGAAIASSPRYDRGYYVDRRYPSYGGGYYGYERPYYPRCERVMRWDPYYGDYVPVRYCD